VAIAPVPPRSRCQSRGGIEVAGVQQSADDFAVRYFLKRSPSAIEGESSGVFISCGAAQTIFSVYQRGGMGCVRLAAGLCTSLA